MKKITYIFSLFFVGLTMSCEKYLDAPSQSSLDEKTIFSTYDLAQGAIVGIINDFAEVNSYRGRFLPYYGMNTDVEWWNSSELVGDGKADLCVYSVAPNNVTMNTENNSWAVMYSCIERANLSIANLKKYSNPEPGTDFGQLLGTALTLRAVLYSDLLKGWGDVVARFEPITSETLYLPKSSRDTIYKKLILDLEEAATLVAWPNETQTTSTVEGISKSFVKGLRARLCLAASGYSQYPDGVRRSTDPELSVAKLYPIALQECRDIIDNGSVILEPSFETIFKKNCQDNIATGGESLWEIPFSDGKGRMLFTYAVQHQGIDQHTGQPKGGLGGPVPNLFYDYDVKDSRRDVTCVPYEWGTPTGGVAKQQLRSVKNWCFGKFRYEWMNRYVTATNDDGVNKMYMRYAEIILMAAEIENELNGPAAAAPYLKQIRQRAFDPADWTEKVDAYVDALASKEDMFNAIVTEHGLEFCGEMLRKQALIRWNLLKTKMDETKAKMYALRDLSGEYADVPSTIYYDYVADDEGRMTDLVIYGLNRGETDINPSGYANTVTWLDPTKLTDEKINSIYAKNPDQYQFWPIWQYFLDNSNGTLANDYGY